MRLMISDPNRFMVDCRPGPLEIRESWWFKTLMRIRRWRRG